MTTGPTPERPAASAGAAVVLPADLAGDIARQLEEFGEYRAVLDPRDPQRLVDLRWAALAVGRELGRRVQVIMTKAVHDGDTSITARVIEAPMSRRGIPSQRRHP